MKKSLLILSSLMILTGCAVAVQAQQLPPGDLPAPGLRTTPGATVTPTQTITTSPTPTMALDSWYLTPTAVVGAGGKTFGWQGEIGCFDCTPFNVRIRLTHYNPQLGDLNCWLWSDEFNWCMSETYSGIPWESVWGFGAACPSEWMIGTWVEVPGVGSFVCFDHGDMVKCDYETGVCAVDLLGPGGADWDGKQVDAVLWVPLKPRKY